MAKWFTNYKKKLTMINKYRKIEKIVSDHREQNIYDKYMKVVRIVYAENESV